MVVAQRFWLFRRSARRTIPSRSGAQAPASRNYRSDRQRADTTRILYITAHRMTNPRGLDHLARGCMPLHCFP